MRDWPCGSGRQTSDGSFLSPLLLSVSEQRQSSNSLVQMMLLENVPTGAGFVRIRIGEREGCGKVNNWLAIDWKRRRLVSSKSLNSCSGQRGLLQLTQLRLQNK